MVLRFLCSLIPVDQKRRMVEVFPEHLRKEWNRWELRGLVLLSLALQVSLILSGNRRKYIAKRRIRVFIWSAYMLADWVATVALGLLVDRLGNFGILGNSNKEYGDLTLMAFWAPFLLLHLGGPDTITAYALADNELWLRHLLGLVVQTAAAIYITLLAWKGALISILTIPMLLCGSIKYGERTWVLMSANRDHFRDSVLTDKSSYMRELFLEEAERDYVTAAQAENGRYDHGNTTRTSPSLHPLARGSLDIAQYFFETLTFKRLFVDLILGFHRRDKSQAFFKKQEYHTAFEVIEVELGFAYDVFYTKAPIIYTRFGLFFRLMTSGITLTVLLTFAASIGVKSHTHQLIDIVITYILLIGALLLEAYAVGSLILSDWTYIWFSRNTYKIPLLGSLLDSLLKGKRWSNSMYQYSLLDFCLNQKSSAFQLISRFIHKHNRLLNLWEKFVSSRQLKHHKVSRELKSFIFTHFKEKVTDTDLDLRDLLTCRGAISLKRQNYDSNFKWAVDVEFDHSILIWHIATDLCYHLDKNKRPRHSNSDFSKQDWDDHMEYSKQLADYMLYILVMCPFMLSIGNGIIRFRDTYVEAFRFFNMKNHTSKLEAYEMLGQVDTKVSSENVQPENNMSVLFEACKLAASLNEMGDPSKMWKTVGDVWVEMFGYAASQCKGYDHAQQLEKGGELLTHVWLLMAHLGISEHFKMIEGRGRVELAVT